MTHIKRIDEMSGTAAQGGGKYDESRYYYVDYLNMEVYVHEDFRKFAKQFDRIPTPKIYDTIVSLYDFTSQDERPDRNDRETLLEWLYEYCCADLDENANAR